MAEFSSSTEKSTNNVARNVRVGLVVGAVIAFACTDFEGYYADRSTGYDNPNGILPDAIDVRFGIPLTDLWTDRVTLRGNPPTQSE